VFSIGLKRVEEEPKQPSLFSTNQPAGGGLFENISKDVKKENKPTTTFVKPGGLFANTMETTLPEKNSALDTSFIASPSNNDPIIEEKNPSGSLFATSGVAPAPSGGFFSSFAGAPMSSSPPQAFNIGSLVPTDVNKSNPFLNSSATKDAKAPSLLDNLISKKKNESESLFGQSSSNPLLGGTQPTSSLFGNTQAQPLGDLFGGSNNSGTSLFKTDQPAPSGSFFNSISQGGATTGLFANLGKK
jgi:hypothetical protein